MFHNEQMRTQRQSVHARVEPELRLWLEAEAERRFVSTSYLINKALDLLRDQMPDGSA